MVVPQTKASHVLTAIHLSRYTCGLNNRTYVLQPSSNSFVKKYLLEQTTSQSFSLTHTHCQHHTKEHCAMLSISSDPP